MTDKKSDDDVVAEFYVGGKPVQTYYRPASQRASRQRKIRITDPLVFVGPKLKIERAKRHILDLKAAVKAFHDRSPYEFVRKVDPNTGENVYRVKVKETVPIEFSGIIGDAFHNLRSALDGLVCDLIRASGQSDVMNGGFPISKRTKRLKPGTVTKIQGVSTKAERLILGLKTRKGWNGPMWMLHWLDIIDKHNRIVAIAAATIKVVARGGIPFHFTGPDGSLRIGGPGPDGTPLLSAPGVPARFRQVLVTEDDVEIYRSTGHFHEEVQVSLGVAFAETDVTQGQPISYLSQIRVFDDGRSRRVLAKGLLD